ncbi:hypothetical protein [Corynebacterium neomassiliense]|nr:hypothetical protein [Corynebacterium neomassiliense]
MTELEGRLGDAVREGAEPGSPLADARARALGVDPDKAEWE